MPSPFTLKLYQEQCLTALRNYLAEVASSGDADTAFYKFTRRPYHAAPALPGLPYICLRVPTGGGKTILAAHSVAVAASAFLKSDTPCVLWLVPSQTIRDQTLATLQDRTHPNRRALADRFGENLRVMTVTDALYAKRADYDGGACVIVSTLQAFRREETEGLKVYEANGELMDHFTALPDALRHLLDKGPGGDPVPSLANVLRIRRPVVIVDEAHNARTALSFDVLARLAPSLIVEFTATPVTPAQADAAKGIIPSNVLHQVSAAELKTAQMIKLPVVLRGRPDPNDTIADAIGWLDELAATAAEEEADTGEFVRPIMLLQAERKSKTEKTLHAEEVKHLLIENFRQPKDRIALATGEHDELTGKDLFARDCKIRFVITQAKLREGWDCSFAYVLCSVAEQKSATAVEQVLGRVLRLPGAKWKKRADLNRAYAFATTTSFQTAAANLRDGLVANGFEKIEAQALVQADADTLRELEPGGSAFVYADSLPKELNFSEVQAVLEPATAGRVQIDPATGSIKARGALSDVDRTSLLQAVELAGGTDAARTWAEAYVHRTRGARLAMRDAKGTDRGFGVPRLVVRRNGTLELFDRTHFLDIPWALESCDPAPVRYFAPPSKAADEAHLDVSAQGKAVVSFVSDLHEQLSLAMEEHHWTKAALVNWIDRALPRNARLDVTRVSSTLFIGKALDAIMAREGMNLEALARAKFRLLDALVKVIGEHRDVREQTAFDQALFPQSGLELETSADEKLIFSESRYSYNQPYRGSVEFKKHFARIIGDLEPKGDEHDCAVYIDRLPEVETWVRNTSQKQNSFWLQSSPNKFYPDFVAALNDGRVLVVEYKGDRADLPEEQNKKKVGELWADRSGGACLFAWVENRNYAEIARVISG